MLTSRNIDRFECGVHDASYELLKRLHRINFQVLFKEIRYSFCLCMAARVCSDCVHMYMCFVCMYVFVCISVCTGRGG